MIFCMQINIKVSYKLISTLWVSKFLLRYTVMGIIYGYNQPFSKNSKYNKFTIYLQYLKKEVRDGVFCMQINIKVSTSWHHRF